MDENEALDVIKDVICKGNCEYDVEDPCFDICGIDDCRICKALGVLEDLCMEAITERMSDKIF